MRRPRPEPGAWRPWAGSGPAFVLARDAVAGVPTSYADAVIDNTLSLLATVTTTDEVVAAWS